MNRYLLTLSLLLVAGTSAYMSVYGLRSVFTSHSLVVICMGLGMEIGKLLTVSYLYRKWTELNGLYRTFYISVISVLVLLSSVEILGFLSQSHMAGNKDLSIVEAELRAVKKEASLIRGQLEVIDRTLEGLPVSYVSRRINERKTSGYERKQDRLLELSRIESKIETELIATQQWAGPISAVTMILRIDEHQAVGAFILLIVIVLEPLSVGLTLAVNAIWEEPNSGSKMGQYRAESRGSATDELKLICEKYTISISKLAEITGRKKLKTCEEWISGKAPVPPRAFKLVENWIRDQNQKLVQAE